MSLFDADLPVHLQPHEWDIFKRPIVNSGGAQILLEKLHGCPQPQQHTLIVPVELLDKAYQYAYDYGGGGWQDRFKALVKAAMRGGQWKPV